MFVNSDDIRTTTCSMCGSEFTAPYRQSFCDSCQNKPLEIDPNYVEDYMIDQIEAAEELGEIAHTIPPDSQVDTCG